MNKNDKNTGIQFLRHKPAQFLMYCQYRSRRDIREQISEAEKKSCKNSTVGNYESIYVLYKQQGGMVKIFFWKNAFRFSYDYVFKIESISLLGRL